VTRLVRKQSVFDLSYLGAVDSMTGSKAYRKELLHMGTQSSDRQVTRRGWPRFIAGLGAVTLFALASVAALALAAVPAGAAASLNGTGSSFAAPALTQWDADVSHAPYSLTVNYSSTSSGQGRYEFTNETTDFAASDVGYVNASTGSVPPSFPFDFIPITAAGVAFMYNIPGLTQKLQLTSYTACLVLTGQVTNWDDPVFQQNGANSGVTLPNLQIAPVTEEDPAGTNYVLEEYCIDEQPSVWAKYATNVAGTSVEGVGINPTTPGSNWVPPGNGYDEETTAAVASTIASTPGSIGAVQENYAIDSGFTGSNPGQAVASVENASGDFTQPTPVDVASALAYATQNADGTHKLDFAGTGPNVYNPSTYSYLLTPTTGWSAAKGVVLSNYVNYVLTLGQHEAPSMDFATLGLSLERYGIDKVIADVPGAVDPTASENTAYSCGDLTPTEVQAGQTTPTCGVTNGAAPPAPPGEAAITATAGGTTATTVAAGAAVTATTQPGTVAKVVKKKATVKKATTTTTVPKKVVKGPVTAADSATHPEGTSADVTATTAGPYGGAAGTGDATTAGVTVTTTGPPARAPLAFTGFNPFPLISIGGVLVVSGLVGRRQVLRRARRSA
jgi:ABC-type phosphate transport system substrate-binding protein